MRYRLIYILLAVFLPVSAYAQAVDQSQLMERLDHMEHNMNLLQRQVARGEPASGGGTGEVSNPAQLEVRLSELEQQLRELRGKNEENDNKIRKLTEDLEKQRKDTEFRFNEIASNTASKTVSKPVASSSGTLEKPPEKSGAVAGAGTSRSTEDTPKATGSEEDTNFTSPREHYNYAFRLLNQTKYEESATAFEAFTKKYPRDPLIGNAYYWEGETYYIRRDFVKAADNFRKGFEALPEGPKAPDNLLKLSMALNNLGRTKDACLVLQQVSTKFKKTAGNVVEKADQEQKRIGCKNS